MSINGVLESTRLVDTYPSTRIKILSAPSPLRRRNVRDFAATCFPAICFPSGTLGDLRLLEPINNDERES